MLRSGLLVLSLFCVALAFTPPYASIEEYYAKREAYSDDYAVFESSKVDGQLNYYYVPINVQLFGKKHNVTGHLFIVNNPARGQHFSYLAPFPKGCGHRVTTGVTAQAANCTAAMNLGFFNMANGDCIGNFISRGATHMLDGNGHANFGLREDGKFVMGYLSANAVKDMSPKIRELAAGVLWLVRDGVEYWEKSQEREGAANGFITEMAPRVAIGHSKAGQLLLLEIDGRESSDDGMSIPQFAEYCRKLGFYNAINMDGGGSATVLLSKDPAHFNMNAINRCSDDCGVGKSSDCPWKSSKCQRTVTTITCLANY